MTMILPVAALILIFDSSLLLARRREASSQAGFWEIPGGKLEAGESPAEAVRREIREELDIEVPDPSPFISMCSAQDSQGRSILLHVFLAQSPHMKIQSRDHDAIRWIPFEELSSLLDREPGPDGEPGPDSFSGRISGPDLTVLRLLALQWAQNPQYFSCFG